LEARLWAKPVLISDFGFWRMNPLSIWMSDDGAARVRLVHTWRAGISEPYDTLLGFLHGS
jgi:hypothetical protein